MILQYSGPLTTLVNSSTGQSHKEQKHQTPHDGLLGWMFLLLLLNAPLPSESSAETAVGCFLSAARGRSRNFYVWTLVCFLPALSVLKYRLMWKDKVKSSSCRNFICTDKPVIKEQLVENVKVKKSNDEIILVSDMAFKSCCESLNNIYSVLWLKDIVSLMPDRDHWTCIYFCGLVPYSYMFTLLSMNSTRWVCVSCCSIFIQSNKQQ